MLQNSNFFIRQQEKDLFPVLSIDPIQTVRSVTQQKTASKSGMRYLVADWKASRNRIPMDGANKSAVKGILGSVSIGGAIGTAIPVIGTAIGSLAGGLVGGFKAIFGGKDTRLVEHMEGFYRELCSQTFGSGSFNVGLKPKNGNGKNAPSMIDQFPKNEMEPFLINAGKEFCLMARDLSGITSYDRETLLKTAETLRFTDAIPARGQNAVYLSYKVDPVIVNAQVSQTGQGVNVSQTAEASQKITASVALGIISLLFFRG